MKRLFLLSLSLLALVVASAQQHWTYQQGQHLNETLVYAQFMVNGQTASPNDYGVYQFAAFVGDELRGVGEVVHTNDGMPLLLFRIEGDLSSEQGAAIAMKAWQTSSETEYDLGYAAGAAAPTFTGETVGPPSSPVTITLTLPQSISLSDVRLNVGETVTLTDYLTVTPEGAALPNNLTWTPAPNNTVYSISGNQLTALEPGYVTLDVTAGSLSAQGHVWVFQPATALSLLQDELTVSVGTVVERVLPQYYELLPASTTDRVRWTSADASVVGTQDRLLTALASGDVVLTGTVYDEEDKVRETIAPVQLTVHVVQPVTSIETRFMEVPLECSVGDDLTAYFTDGQAYQVFPANATNKAVTITLQPTPTTAPLTIGDDGRMTATGEGMAYVEVASVEDPQVSTTVVVRVHNDVQDVSFTSSQLSVLLTGGQMDISQQVKDNIVFAPQTATDFYSIVNITSSDESVVSITDLSWGGGDVELTATALATGTATITVTFEKKDYLQATFNYETSGVTTVTKTFEVVVTEGVASIATPFGYKGNDVVFLHCSAGDVLTSYFVDGQAFTVLPATAPDKRVSISYAVPSADHVVSIAADGTITALDKPGSEGIQVTSLDNPQATCTVWVFVHNDYKTITAAQDSYEVELKDQPVDISEMLATAFVLGPQTAQTFGGQPTVVSSDPSVVEIGEQAITAKAAGTATITMTIVVKDYLRETFDPTRAYETSVSASFQVVVRQGVTGLEIVWPTDMANGMPSQIIVKPVPQGATFQDDLSRFVLTSSYAGNGDWAAADDGDVWMQQDGSVVLGVIPRIPGQVSFTVTYHDGSDMGLTQQGDPIDVGYTYDLRDGWSWQTIPYGYPDANNLGSVFGTQLVEIRTQDDQLYNDPVYGYFGNLDLLTQNRCFKVKMHLDEAIPEPYVFHDGQLGYVTDVTLRRGWNWMGCPCVFERLIAHAFSSDMLLVEGDRIVSKDDGFAVYNGTAWEGNLQVLRPGQGYMFYNAYNGQRALMFSDELQMADRDDEYAQPARRRAAAEPLYSYDASRFRDNMTIVARLDNVPTTDACHVYAFVGDECRGEGQYVAGKLFITVHAEQGEQVGFRLFDAATGEESLVEQTVPMQTMLGSLRQPLSLTKGRTVTTAIADAQAGAATTAAEAAYDLTGRRTDAQAKGITLLRMADGTVRKQLKK